MIDIEHLGRDLIAIFSDNPIITVPVNKGILVTESASITETLSMLQGLGYDTKAISIYGDHQ